jgi:heat shock protein HslJ
MAASASRITTLFLVLIAQQVLVLAQQPPTNRPLEGTYWKATELAGKPTPAPNANREAHLLFKGGSVSGSNGCNRIARWRITGHRLELLDAAGKCVAAFTGRTPSSPSTSPKLDGTVWQLVKFQGGDDKTPTPDDGSKYTIQFMSGGQLAVRLDCNRGRGTWTSSGENQIMFGPLALTRAQCPPHFLEIAGDGESEIRQLYEQSDFA